MKHLKIFENEEYQDFWLFDYYIKKSRSHCFKLFPDKESAELAILTVVNQERADTEGNRYTDDMYFTDVDEAHNWYEENYNDVILEYYELKLQKKQEPSSKLKRMRDAKKYNL